MDSLEYLWRGLNLPPEALASLHLTGTEQYLPSSFKIADLAQSSIGLAALLAAQIYALRCALPSPPTVHVPRLHATLEFMSERLYRLANISPPSTWGPLGGLHKSADGYIRLHDSFPNHRAAAISLLNCPPNASRADIAAQVARWRSLDLENAAISAGAVVAALRSPAEWDALPQAAAIPDFPIRLRRIGDAPPGLPDSFTASPDKCLRGLRVVELSRVIAAPVAGRTLAAHGADVLWVTSPTLPDLPGLDRDLSRGKRTVQLDLATEEGSDELETLLEDAHVFIQGYRPGSLAARGFSPARLVERFASRDGSEGHGRGIICANLSAYGPDGPWAARRGFDSLVQTCSGMNVSEAAHYGTGEPARAMPCQALDHGAGYFLAAGVMAALYRQATEGGSWEVDVSLAGVMKYLRSLGQYEGRGGFEMGTGGGYAGTDDVPVELLESRQTGFGEMTALRHAAGIEGVAVGWEVMPKPLGSDEKRWL